MAITINPIITIDDEEWRAINVPLRRDGTLSHEDVHELSVGMYKLVCSLLVGEVVTAKLSSAERTFKIRATLFKYRVWLTLESVGRDEWRILEVDTTVLGGG